MSGKTISELTALASITDNDMFIVRDPEEPTGAKTKYALASTVASYMQAEIGGGDDTAAIEALTGTGLLARTADNTWALRTITATAAEITVTNGDGVAGAPTLSLPSALTFTGKTITGGTFSGPTITGVASFPDGSASAPSITNTGDTNTGIFFPADNEVAIATAGGQRVTVDSSGRLVIGHTEAIVTVDTDGSAVTPTTQTHAASGIGAYRWANDATAIRFFLSRSRGASIGDYTVLQSGDDIGQLIFAGADGTDFEPAAAIKVEVDGTPGAGDMPGRIVFGTTADGAEAVTDRLILDSAGVLKPASNDGVVLGTTALGFADLHLATGATINVANGNAVITHSSGIFTVSTGDLRVTTAGTNAASVVTVGGMQTLTAKTLTSPVIGTSPTAAGATWTDLGTVTEGTFANGGLHILDTNATHDLIITPGSNLTADRVLTITTGDAARTLDISAASVTVSTFGASLVDDADGRAAAATIGTWKVLGASAVAASHTGDTNETTLATVTVPAGAMGANGVLRIVSTWTVTNSANNKTARVRLNGIAGTIYQGITVTTSVTMQFLALIRNRNATNSQVGMGSTSSGLGTAGSAATTSAIDTTAAVDLVLTAQLANTGETITLEAYQVELFYQA